MASKGIVAVVVPPSAYTAPFGWEHAAAAPLEGATIAAGVLRKAGYEVQAYDLRAHPEGRSDLLDSLPGIKAVCIAGTPDSYPFVKQFSLQITRAQHGNNVAIVIGGPLATYSYKTVLQHTKVQCCIIGECEHSLPFVVEKTPAEVGKIFPIAYRDIDTGAVVGPTIPVTAPPVPNMNDVSVVPIPQYRETWARNYQDDYAFPLVYYATQRGCTNRCAFCAENRRWRAASLVRLRTDLRAIALEQGVAEVFLSDPTFNTDIRHCENVLTTMSEILREKPQFSWSCTIRATMPSTDGSDNAPVPYDFFLKMRNAGCKAVFVGIESAEQGLLDRHLKRIQTSEVEETLRAAAKAKLEVHGFLILGLPGETTDSLGKTVSLVYRNRFIPRVRYAMPLPGTLMYDEERKAASSAHGGFEEGVLRSVSAWENKPSDHPYKLAARLDDLPLQTAMLYVSWRALELPDDDMSDFARSSPLIRKSFQRWLKHSDMRLKPLFFPNPETESAISASIKTHLASTIDGRFNLPGATIGRVLVHGSIPHLVWSSSEVYRPVAFFFGELDPACQSCDRVPINPLREHPATIVSPFWRRKILGLENADQNLGHVPKCWTEAFLAAPDASCWRHKDCAFRSDKRAPGCWSAIEVLSLSRMRLRQWALRKREILQSPAAKSAIERNIMKLFKPDALIRVRNPGEPPDNVNTAFEARSLFKQCLERSDGEALALATDPRTSEVLKQYLNAFSTEAWESSQIWADSLRKLIPPRIGNESDILKKLSQYGAKSAEPSPDNWIKEWGAEWGEEDAKDFAQAYRWLSQDCSVFMDADGKPVFQGALPVAGMETDVFVYFEVTNQRQIPDHVWSASRLGAMSCGEAFVPDDDGLIQYCQSAILPWVELLKTADERWQNHQAVDGVFPAPMRAELLARHHSQDPMTIVRSRTHPWKSDPRHHAAIQTDDLMRAVTRAERLYSRRVTEEEAPPVPLALATMGDMWRFCFRDIVKPHYAEFERFQQLLTAIPEYRDHLTHSIQVFLLGNRIIDKMAETTAGTRLLKLWARYNPRLPDIQHQDALSNAEPAIFKLQWTLASLMHDFALPASKANEVVAHLFETFLGITSRGRHGSNGLKEALESEEKKHRTFLFALLSKTRMGRQEIEAHGQGPVDILPLISEMTYQRLFDDHGFLSAIYLFNQLFEKSPGWWTLKKDVLDLIFSLVPSRAAAPGSAYEKIAESIVLEVLDAIVKHNAFNKEYRLSIDDAPAYQYPAAYFSARESIFDSPVPGLLLLCDTLCDWGRVIHADDLSRHDHRSRAVQSKEVERPECLITGVDADGDHVTIRAEYSWRLPCTHSAPQRLWCLDEIYTELCAETWPYAPSFTPWRGCAKCQERKDKVAGTRDPHNCSVFRGLERFLKAVLVGQPPNQNRLRFPSCYDDSFNRIQLSISFYGHTIAEGTLGTGLGTQSPSR